MKKLLLLLPLLLLLTGCAASSVPDPEAYAWRMTTVQSLDAGGSSVACAPDTPGIPQDTQVLTLTCTMKDETLTLTDETAGQTHSGSYRTTDVSRDALRLAITVGNTEGFGTVAYTTYADGTRQPTLILVLGDYTLNFTAD